MFPEQVVRPSGVAGVDLVAGSRAVNDWNLPRPFDAPYEAQTCLRAFLDDVRARYDYVLIDCPPNLCLCSWTALVASDHLIVPLQAEDYGQGIVDVQDSVALVTAGPNPALRLLGYLITMFNAGRRSTGCTSSGSASCTEPTSSRPSCRMPPTIPRRSRIGNRWPSTSRRAPVREGDPRLADEVTERLSHGATQTEAA